MSDSRKTPIYWSAGFAVLLIAYVASPPLLVFFAFRGSPPGPPFEQFLKVFYKPLEMLYEVSPWYKQYIDVTNEMAMP